MTSGHFVVARRLRGRPRRDQKRLVFATPGRFRSVFGRFGPTRTPGCVVGPIFASDLTTQYGLCRYFYGSEGTRTRDLRRDRPSRAPRRPATNASERPHLQGFSALESGRHRMVEPNRPTDVWATSGATKSCLHGQRSGWRTREIACAKTRIVFSFPSHGRCFRRADALALARPRPDASPRHAGAGGASLPSRRRPSRINAAVPIAA